MENQSKQGTLSGKRVILLGGSLLVKRVGEAEEIAQAFIYLMQQQFGTGQNIVIDGGAVLV